MKSKLLFGFRFHPKGYKPLYRRASVSLGNGVDPRGGVTNINLPEAEVKRAMLDWWGLVIWEQYGSTETGVVTLAGPPTDVVVREKERTVGLWINRSSERIRRCSHSAQPSAVSIASA